MEYNDDTGNDLTLTCTSNNIHEMMSSPGQHALKVHEMVYISIGVFLWLF